MTDAQLELVLDARAHLGEGPIWDHRIGQLVWVDIMAGRVNLFDPSTGRSSAFEVGAPVGAAALRSSGGYILAMQDCLAHLDAESGQVSRLCGFPGAAPDLRMNDGRCDPAGRFWAGTMALDLRGGAGALYRFDPGIHVSLMLTDITCSNGIDWTEDARCMYYVDSMTRRIDVFDYELAAGTLARRRTFAEIREDGSFPDGLTVDSEGNVWVALWGGGCIQCFGPDGGLRASVEVPATQVTSCTFGGEDLGDLYITSARTGLAAADLAGQPHAGSLFRFRPGVKGRPASEFGG